MDKKFGIIVPYYNKWHITHKCLMDLHKYIPPENVELILVNDSSTDIDCETGLYWWQNHVQIHTIRYKKNNENLGFGGSMNVGAKIAINHGADVLVFLSNDVSVYGNFIPEILSTLDENGERVLIGGETIYWDGGWNSFNIDGHKVIISYANGWFLSCTSDVWLDLGGFDSIYGKYDYEDIDLSTRAMEIGCSIISLNSKNIEHKHQGTSISALGEDRLAHTNRNRELYKMKWENKLLGIGREINVP